jgi:hypothetical protein
MTFPRSTLAALMRDIDPDAGKRIAAKAWHDHGLLIVKPEWDRSFVGEQEIRNIGNKMWGKRNAG